MNFDIIQELQILRDSYKNKIIGCDNKINEEQTKRSCFMDIRDELECKIENLKKPQPPTERRNE